MRIAFIGQKGIPATYGGIERFTEEVSLRLAALGHDVTVYTRPHYLAGCSEGLRADFSRVRRNCIDWKRVSIRVIPSLATKHLDAITHTFFCSLDALMRKYDVIVYQAIGPSSLCFIPRWLSGSKVACIIHSLDWRRQKWGKAASVILRAAEYPSTRFPHQLFVISDTLKEYYEERYGRTSRVLTPGIQASPSAPSHVLARAGIKPGSYVLFLNRIVPEKGCHYLLEAFSRLRIDKQLVIVGDTSQEPDYYEQLKKEFSDRDIIFLGYVDNGTLPALYSGAALYVLPSEVEGLPQTLLEAAIYGCPTLASDIPENIGALGGKGFYFRSRSVESLANALRSVLDNPSHAKRLAEEARNFVLGAYSWDHTCSVLLEGLGHA